MFRALAGSRTRSAICAALVGALCVTAIYAAKSSGWAAARRDVHRGRVVAGTMLRHRFAIRNDTRSPFSIIGIKKSCVCQHAEVEAPAVVEPGAHFYLEAAVSTVEQRGPFAVRFTVETTSPERAWAAIELVMRADVVRPITVTPEHIVLGRRALGDVVRRELHVVAHDPAVDLSAMTLAFRGVGVDVKDSYRSARLCVFSVELAPTAPPGDIGGQITLDVAGRATATEGERILVPVVGSIVGP